MLSGSLHKLLSVEALYTLEKDFHKKLEILATHLTTEMSKDGKQLLQRSKKFLRDHLSRYEISRRFTSVLQLF